MSLRCNRIFLKFIEEENKDQGLFSDWDDFFEEFQSVFVARLHGSGVINHIVFPLWIFLPANIEREIYK